MSTAPRDARPPFSLLAFALLAAGGMMAALAALATLRGVDAPELARQALARGQGAVSEETSAWLQELRPIRLLGLIGGGLSIAGAGLHLARRRWRNWLERATLPGTSRAIQTRHWIDAFAVTLVLLTCHRTFFSGFFRYDDFELLAVGKAEPLARILFAPHGDHVLPFCRLLAWAAAHLTGPATWPWNLAIIGCLAATLLVAVRLLEELGASAGARLVFLILATLWSPWAEITSGYYILSSYVAIAALSLAAWLACLRWQREHRPAALGVFAACLLFAPTLDVSGVYLLAAGPVFILAGLALAPAATWRRRLGEQLPLLAVNGLAAALTALWLGYAYFVLHPGTFLGMASASPRSLARLGADLFYVFDVGLLVTMLVPFIYARLPLLLLVGAASGALIAWIAWQFPVLRAASRTRRIHLLAATLVTAGICLMVILGRPPEDSLAVRWAAKHVGPAYVWLCLLLALGWDAVWKRTVARVRLAELTVLALGIFLAAQTAFGLLGMAVEFPPFGYPAEIRDAGRRRLAVASLRSEIVDKFPAANGVPAVIPTLDGEYIRLRHPSLFSYNLSHYQPFFGPADAQPELVTGPGMQVWHTSAVRDTPRLAETVSPYFLELLAHDPGLRRYYLAEVPLALETARPARVQPLASPPPGDASPLIRETGFAPETAPRLRLWLSRNASSDQSPAPHEPLSITVVFHSAIVGGDWHGRTVIPAGTAMPVTIDLRQAYAFSLGKEISRLRLEIPPQDSLRLHLAELVP